MCNDQHFTTLAVVLKPSYGIVVELLTWAEDDTVPTLPTLGTRDGRSGKAQIPETQHSNPCKSARRS